MFRVLYVACARSRGISHPSFLFPFSLGFLFLFLSAFKLRAEAHLGAEQFEEAVRDYQRARQIDPNDGSIQDGR